MAFNDNAVFTASTGYVYIAEPGTAAPTPEQLRDFDPETFGSKSIVIESVTGDSVSATYNGASSTPIPTTAAPAELQAALEGISSIGAGNVLVKGDSLEGARIFFVGDLFGKDVSLEFEGATQAAAEVASLAGWEPIGHTGTEDLPEFGYEGGETETKGSWQKKNLKEVTTEAPVDYVTVKALQFDQETLEMYYGKNASSAANVFGIDNPASGGVQKAVLIVMVDGLFKIAFSAAKASVRRDESITLATDEFSTLPLRATFVKHPGRHLFEWVTPAS